jgi:hypothetical protein
MNRRCMGASEGPAKKLLTERVALPDARAVLKPAQFSPITVGVSYDFTVFRTLKNS